MNALVVYESLWGNTAAIARAIGEGIGPGTEVKHTGEIDPDEAASAQTSGARRPGSRLQPAERGHQEVRRRTSAGTRRHRSRPLPTTAEGLDRGFAARHPALAAAFDTRVRGPLGHGGASQIEKLLEERGYRIADRSQGFYIVNEKNVKAEASMLRAGEIDRAIEWGQLLLAYARLGNRRRNAVRWRHGRPTPSSSSTASAACATDSWRGSSRTIPGRFLIAGSAGDVGKAVVARAGLSPDITQSTLLVWDGRRTPSIRRGRRGGARVAVAVEGRSGIRLVPAPWRDAVYRFVAARRPRVDADDPHAGCRPPPRGAVEVPPRVSRGHSRR